MPDPEPATQPELFKFFTGPVEFLKQAVEAVPAVKYALGVGGIAAVIAIVAGFLDLRIALVGVPIVIVFMAILLIFSRASAGVSPGFRWAPAFLIWFCAIAMAVVTTLFAVTFFVQPEILKTWGLRSFYEQFNLVPSQEVQQRTAAQFIQEFEDAYTGSGSLERVTEALQQLTMFWRQPEQRYILCRFRENPTGEIFESAARLVYANPDTLMRDVDTVARYFDGIARCVSKKQCDFADTCSYFQNPMDDFRMLYTDYFADLHALEGRDPMANIRTFVQSCPTSEQPPVPVVPAICKPAQGAS